MKKAHNYLPGDIEAHLEVQKAEKRVKRAYERLNNALERNCGRQEAFESLCACHDEHQATKKVLGKIPKARRAYSARILETAELHGRVIAQMGGDYSGVTRHGTAWGAMADAMTSKTAGDRYSNSCRYRREDADHCVVLDPRGVEELVKNERLRKLSAADGLPLIALYPDQSAVWVRRKGKAIKAERGWVVGNTEVCFHSTLSREHAERGFRKKCEAQREELRERRLHQREARRAALVARMCKGVTATIEDARALGFCEPGIAAFQAQHGISDVATLPQLVNTGNAAAIRLALKVARSVQRAPRVVVH